ncbi:type I glutamate--ammonia ligase [Acidobacteria bacterium AH-259-A15]|nr:type I glutamate--ammonia ligase [Acidobacteria bacterium AH-259-A15]
MTPENPEDQGTAQAEALGGKGPRLTYRSLVKLIKEKNVEFLDFKFTDLPGLMQHFSMPIKEFSEGMFLEGLGFDGSSIRGFQPIDESDMLLEPDMQTAFIDPFMKHVTLSFICNVKDPITLKIYSRDPRNIAHKAERYLDTTGIADTAYFGPEAEFYIFDDVRFDQTYNQGFYFIDSEEGFWNSGNSDRPNLGYKPRYKEGYFPVPPMDSTHDLRASMVKTMLEIGVDAELHHHEVGTGGQAEIDIRFTTLTAMADSLMKYKYVAKNVARRYNKTVTFMPKPIFMDNGSGMHVHLSLWKGGKNLFFESGRYGDLSELGEYCIGGILHHSSSLLAFTNPTTNSFRRLVPGYEAPINLIYSQRNRSACVRIPMYSTSEKSKRIEFRTPDPSCNPYLAFAAILMAGLDGIENKIQPPPPMDKDLYELPEEEKAEVKSVPGSLDRVINALEEDHDYLLRGDVFTEDLLQMWIDYKRQREIDHVRLRPHPAEFALYFDI